MSPFRALRRVPAQLLLAALLAVGGISTFWFDHGPPVPASHTAARAAIEASDDLNNASTEGAPQQEVVNGWTTTAYLKLISEQLDAEARRKPDNRPVFLLSLVLLGIASLMVSEWRRREDGD